MDLNEFKEAMSSDAVKENERLKKELQELKEQHSKEIKDLSEKLKGYQDDCRALSNRCWAMTGFASGTDFMCYHCELHKYNCPHAKTIDEKINYAKEMMEEM